MLEFSGYSLQEVIYTGSKTVVFRALRETDNKLVIVKSIRTEYPSITEISQLKYEYQISHSIEYPGVVRTYSLEIDKNNIGIVKEDFNAITLKEFFQANEIPIACFLEIAIQMSDILNHLHQQNIIHKDVNPSNILINTETNQVKITDFSIASRLQTESYQRNNYSLLEGTPAYISPEQTGRMNRGLDYRTDLYSLGVTLYEFLIGHLPFQTSDLLELIHHHISEYPLPPHRISSNIPTAISDIVMKLMAKNAEERYQSALGLKADLEYCLNQLTSRDYIPNFSLGKLDHNSQFLIPQKLYGRSTEVSKLLSAFERVSNGDSELILVCGYSGIGKTSIVNEIHKPILRKRGFFIHGKFEQLQRNIPYFAFLQGFREFIENLLSEPLEIIHSWRDSILSSIGNNGQILIDNIPELEFIIGEQPAIPELGPTESQNRFNQVFQSFIRVFTQPDHPLVIFLDDLQWADLSSLKLVERLVQSSKNHHLLLIGAYRDNEVDSIHPLMQMLDDLDVGGSSINSIVLEPLAFNAVRQLVNDTLKSDRYKTEDLVDLLYNKSAGNPFFLNQLLNTLYSEGLIFFNYVLGIWEWDIEGIFTIKIIDLSIVDLIAQNIKKLDPDTQNVLKISSCIGNKFSLKDLAIILEEDEKKIASKLWIPLQKGLVLPLSNNYKITLIEDKQNKDILFRKEIAYQFLHDRVQQASYALIASKEREHIHLKIGEILLKTTPKEDIEIKIFDIVNQINLAVSLINKKKKRRELAYLNMIAGRKAKESAAYEIAKKYFDLCLDLLPKSSWDENYNFTVQVYLLSLEISYINAEFTKANELLRKILSNARHQQDIIHAYEFQIPYYFTQNQPVKAIDTALDILKRIKVKIPRNPNKINILVSIIRVKIAHRHKQISDLLNLPILNKADEIAAMRILMAVIPATFVSSPELFPIAISRMVELSLRYGNSPYSIFAYNSFGTLQCGVLGNFKAGYEYSLLALNLLEKLKASEFRSKVYMVFNAFNRPWTDHLKYSVEMLPEGVKYGLENGDIEYVGHCASFLCIYIFLIGENIESAAHKQTKYLQIISECKQEFQSYHAKIWQQVTLNLLEKSDKKVILSGESFSEDFFYSEVIGYRNDLVIIAFYCAKSFLAIIFNDFNEVLKCYKLLERHSRSVPGIIYIALNNFFLSIALLKKARTTSLIQRIKLLYKIKRQQSQLKKWADSCPDNFLHKYQLIEAEIAGISGNQEKAMKLYDCAIQTASKNRYIQEEAIANERAAEFYFEIGRDKVAQVYLTDAYYGYAKWGAIAKVNQLQEKYPDIFSRLQKSLQTTCSIQTTQSSSTTAGLIDLDLASVLKVSQAISEEIIIDHLLEKLMQVLMQSAGAQSIFIILERNNHFFIEASASKEYQSIRQTIPVSTSGQVPCSIINYVERTLEPIFLGDALLSNFSHDPYIKANLTKSLLCLPMINQGHLIGMVYLENNLANDAFRRDHLEVLRLLCAQAAISLENAYLYEDLKQSQAREQAEREINELKSRFISMTSHEFRTPLTAILGTTELIKHYGQGWDAKKQNTYLDRIQKNVKHMTGLLDDVLVLSKADVGKVEFNPEPINLEAFLTTLVEEFQLNTKRDQRIEFKFEGHCPNTYVDEKILRQILGNLLSNAIKYSSENTVVRFDVDLTDEGEVTFFIQDQGIGIPEVDQQHLFESFHRATNVGQIQGTGLGLAIVKKSVDLHRGTITFDSVADQGTTFVVKLPVAAEALDIERD